MRVQNDSEEVKVAHRGLASPARPLVTATIVCLSILALLYPISLYFSVDDWNLRLRWFQNTPVFSVFLWSAFPLSVLLLLEVSTELSRRLTAPDRRREVLVCAVVLSALTLAVEVDGFRYDPIAPHLLRGATAVTAQRIENRLRRAQFDGALNDPAHREEYKRDRQQYEALVKHFGAVRDVFTRGSVSAWAMFVVSVVGALAVPWLFTIIIALVRNKTVGTVRDVDLVILAVVLLLTFVPFRAYSDWYRDSIFDLDPLQTMSKFLALSAFVLAFLGVLVIQRRRTRTKLAFGLVTTVAPMGVIIAKGPEKWGWLRYMVYAPPLQVFAVYVLFAVVITLYALSVRDGALDV